MKNKHEAVWWAVPTPQAKGGGGAIYELRQALNVLTEEERSAHAIGHGLIAENKWKEELDIGMR